VRRAGRVVALALLALGVAAAGARVLAATRTLAEQPCNADDRFPGLVIVAACVACFGAGHLSGHLRDSSRAGSARERGPAERNGRLLHLVLAGFLLAVALILAYETVGLWNPWGLRPITSYVR